MAITLALAKAQCRITEEDEDDLVQQYLDAAVLEVEKMSGQLLTRREVTQELSQFGCWLPLFWGPDPDDLTIAYFDTDDADQEIADARIVRGRVYAPETGWPGIAEDSVITLTYTAGWTDPPADLADAVLVLVAGKYDNREGAYDHAVNAAGALCGRYRTITV